MGTSGGVGGWFLNNVPHLAFVLTLHEGVGGEGVCFGGDSGGGGGGDGGGGGGPARRLAFECVSGEHWWKH